MIQIAQQIADPSPHFPAWKAAGYAYARRETEAVREAQKFVQGMQKAWAGDATAGPAEYVKWLLECCPFRRAEDIEHLATGLRLAGLTTS